MAGKGKGGARANPRAATQHSQSAERPPRPARARPDRADRPEPGRDRAAAAGHADSGSGGRGGASAGRAAGNQSSVKDMIQRLDRHRGDGTRSESPTKRPRKDSLSGSVSSVSSVSVSAADQPLTELTLRSVMQNMTQQIRGDIASEFATVREEIGRMSTRIRDLEKHIEERDNFIEDIESRLRNRESRVEELEEEMDKISNEHKKRDLIFSGSAVPAPPAQAWAEDVTATAVTMLARCLPDVPVAAGDIDECFRVARGKRIVCRFRKSGRGSVRDEVYENRFGTRHTARRAGVPANSAAAGGSDALNDAPVSSPAGDALPESVEPAPGGATPADHRRNTATSTGSERAAATQQLYVSENLTRRKQDIFHALLAEKRAQKLYTVFTKNGEVFCKTMQYGRKIRVESMGKIPYVLRQ